MEGGGEGMVAIVQGLQDAGLAVTVLNCTGKYHGRNSDDRTTSIMAPKDKYLHAAMCSAETSTQAQWTNHMDCNYEDRYLSTYQLAHCNIRPLSPVYASAFPLQRPESSKTEGNFFSQSIGQECNMDVPVRDIQSYGKSCILSRGIQNTVSSRVNEEFAESLRRYPVPPEHANSSDYIARLLTHTQAKNTSHNLKSSRPQKDKFDVSNNIKNKTKNIQTYTRMKNEKGNTTDTDVKFSFSGQGQPKKRMRMRSPVNYKTIKYKDNQLNETYDYLKSTSPTRYAKTTEVRYLEDISRCIKETLRQIMDDRPVECPQIQSRYTQHIRDHHRKTSEQQASNTSNKKSQAEMPNLPTASKAVPSSHIEPGSYTCPFRPSVCRFCSNLPPCISNIPPSTSIATERKAEDPAALEEKQIDELWKDQIFNWLQDVPVYAYITPEDKEKRETMVEELANTLIKLKNDEDFEAKAKLEIIKCLNSLPMWMPSTKSEQVSFRNQIFDNLIRLLKKLIKQPSIHYKKEVPKDEISSKEKLRSFTKDFTIDDNAYNKENRKVTAKDIFKEIPIKIAGNKRKSIENLSDQPVSKLKNNTIDLEHVCEKETLDWLKDIPKLSDSAADIQRNNGLIRNFAENLQKLQHENQNDVIVQGRIQDKIKDWLESVMKKKNKHMNPKIEQQKLIEKLRAAKYVNKATSNTSLSECDINGQIRKLSNGSKSDEQKMVQSLAEKQNLRFDAIEIEEEKKSSKKVEENVIIPWNSKTQCQLSNKPVVKILKMSTSDYKTAPSFEDNVNKDYLEEVWNWFNDIPELVKGSEPENQKMVQSLALHLQNLCFEGVEDEDKIQSEISNWLVDELERNGSSTNSKTQEQIVNKLVSNIKKSRRQTKPLSEDSIKEDYLAQVWHWFENIPELSGGKRIENQKNIRSLATKLQNLSAAGIADEDKIRDEISKWLSKETEKKNTKFSPKYQYQLINKLLGKIQKTISSTHESNNSESINEEYLEQIWDWFEDIPELFKDSKSENQKIIQTLATKLGNLRFEQEEDEEAQNKIFNWLANEAEKKGTKLSSKTKNELATKLMAKIKKIPAKKCRNYLDKIKSKPRKHWDKVNASNEETDDFFTNVDGNTLPSSHDPIELSSRDIRKCIKEEINLILHEYQIPNRDEVESNLTEILHDQITRNDNENKINNRVYSILKDVDISDKYAKTISDKLLKTAKDLSLIVNSKNSTLLNRMTILPSEMTPVQKQLFQESTERTIVDFIEEIIGDKSLFMRNKVNEETAKLVRKLDDILADPDIIIKEKDYTICNEVSHFLKKLSLPQNGLVVKLMERIENVGYKTSTPRQSKLDSDFSFNPKREGTSISAIKFDERFTQSKEEAEYVADLINAIQSWTNELLSDLNNNEALINNLILTELVEEITERQKYLQLHSHTKISQEQELEHLKYQVFRCFSKVIDNDKLLLIMAKVESLMNKIRKISVPKLARSTRPDLNIVQIPVFTHSDALNDDISKWVKDNSANYESANVEGKVKDLTHALKHATQDETKIDENIEKEISESLSSVFEDPKNVKVRCMAEDLGNKLKNGLTEDSSFSGLSQSSSQFIIENLTGAIMDFFKSLPLYQRRNNEEKIYILEKLSEELAISLQKLLSTSLEMQSIDFDTLSMSVNEIYNHLKMFPMDPVEKADDSFLLNVAQQLFNYLKNLHLFQDISTRNLRTIEEPLPINKKISAEKLNSISLKENIKRNQAVKEEIKKFLQTFPKNISKSFDQMYIHEKLKQLLKKLEQLSSDDLKPTISSNLVKDAIFQWSKNIPLQTGKTTNDISNALNCFSEQISNILSTTDAFHDSNKLQAETMKFLKQLPMTNKIDDKYLQNIVEQLINKIKERIEGVMKTKPLPKAADILYNSIENWCSELPIAGGSAPEEIERVKTLKQNLAGKLINKVAELNMNPEIFQDDALYEDLLQDQIDNLLATLPLNPELESNLAILIANLIEKITEAKQKIRDEFAGQTYKKQLRETISKTLPHFDISTLEEQISFEELKNSLADAYLNLHYVADNEDQKIKYKKKIADEVENFSNNYLQRHPGTPHDTKKINKDLYSALKKVPIPKDETIRSEVEQVRIKDEINNWIKELPLAENSAVEKVQRNKKVDVLADRLYEIEKEKELHPELDINNKLEKEICNWLKKLPLRPGNGDIIGMAEKLMNKLKSTEPLRRISASTPRKSIEVDEFDYYQISSQTNPSSSYKSQNAPPIPASSLTVDDRAYLEKIRERTIASPRKDSSIHEYRDASVSPLPIDAASQIEATKDCPERRSGTSSQTQPGTNSSVEDSPKIIIKEYFWGASNSKLNESVYRIPCLSNQPSCNINESTTQSHIVPCPRSSSISSRNNFKTPNQIPPYIGPIVTRTSLQEPNSAIQNELHKPSKHVSQNQSPCVSEHESSYPAPEPCRQQPCPGSLSQIGPNHIANQKCPWPKPNRKTTSREQSCVPLPTPCMASSATNKPPKPCLPLCTTPKQIVIRRNFNANEPFRQPCFSLDISEDTPVEAANPKEGSSKCIRERITKFGSLNDDQRPKPCRRLSANISKGVSEESSKWTTVRLPADDGIRDTPCRPRIYRMPCNGKVTSGILREPNIRYGCKYCAPTRRTGSRGSDNSNCEKVCESVRRCSKCCGFSCPHPSGFYSSR